MKYAIKVMLAAEDWIYVSEPTGTMFEVRPVLFDTREAAEEHAKVWRKKGHEEAVIVVEYHEPEFNQAGWDFGDQDIANYETD